MQPIASIQSGSMKSFSAVALAVVGLAALAAQPARRSVTLVVVGGTVITQNAARDIVSPGAVAIDGTDIVEVGYAGGDRGEVPGGGDDRGARRDRPARARSTRTPTRRW